MTHSLPTTPTGRHAAARRTWPLSATQRRIHRLAQYVAWMSAASMLSMGGMMLLLTSDWFTMLVAKHNPGQDYTPATLITVGPQVVLILGFLTVVAALCGGFRRPTQDGQR